MLPLLRPVRARVTASPQRPPHRQGLRPGEGVNREGEDSPIACSGQKERMGNLGRCRESPASLRSWASPDFFLLIALRPQASTNNKPGAGGGL